MAEMEKTIEVDAPIYEVYNQWTQFEDFPHFMEGVEEVHQLDDRRLHWRARIGGKDEEWEAEIVDQVPDRRIAWRATTGAENAGAVLFEPVGDNRTKVTLRLKYEPRGATEKVGDLLGFVSNRVEGDLERFKNVIEERGRATGGWRGEIHGRDVNKPRDEF